MNTERKLFGTDVRPRRRREVLTAGLALRLGAAATRESRRAPARARHPRHARSGEMLESALAAGIASAGATSCSAAS